MTVDSVSYNPISLPSTSKALDSNSEALGAENVVYFRQNRWNHSIMQTEEKKQGNVGNEEPLFWMTTQKDLQEKNIKEEDELGPSLSYPREPQKGPS